MVENKNKTNAWRLTHTSTYNKAKDTVSWLRREFSTQYEACLVEKKHVQICNTKEILPQKGKGHLRRG